MSVIILVADGVRPDTLEAAADRGELPALARLRAEGGLHRVVTAWPSVTGVAYTPFLMGRFPGQVGLPGLRWFDRTRGIGALVGHSRSYVGWGMRCIDRDLSPEAPTLFELAGPSLGALAMIGRGLPERDRVGRGKRFIARVARTHFRGDVHGWLQIDREIGQTVAERIRKGRPRCVFAAFTGIDKTSHAVGHDGALVHDAMRIVDDVAAEIRHDAERDGRWDEMHLWIVSDHGHSTVQFHDDLATLFREMGHRTLAHPWTVGSRYDVAVMVSGNAMAHVYLEVMRRERPFWPALRDRWSATVDALEARDSVDLLILPHSPERCDVRARGRGAATIELRNGRYSYRPVTGDPLGVGELVGVSKSEAWEATIHSTYPDSVVQIAQLASASRSGEVMLSAAPGWDFRGRYEPIRHLSTHGALHREHMLVPLLLNRPVEHTPRRTVDVMPSAVAALGLGMPTGLDGESFVAPASDLVRLAER